MNDQERPRARWYVFTYPIGWAIGWTGILIGPIQGAAHAAIVAVAFILLASWLIFRYRRILGGDLPNLESGIWKLRVNGITLAVGGTVAIVVGIAKGMGVSYILIMVGAIVLGVSYALMAWFGTAVAVDQP